jgi:predicted amidohydrolase YtcJ
MGDIAATRPVQARLPKVPQAGLEASARAVMAEMNRAGITSFGVPGCDGPTLDLFQKFKREEKLSIRIFCMVGNAAATPQQADASIAQIPQIKLFQGDNFIDDIAFGESVYSPLHDPMFATSSNPPAEQLAQWRRMALAIAKAGLPLHVHAELAPTIDAFLDQIESINKEHPIKNLRWMLAHVNQINAAQLERMKRLGIIAAVHPWAVINGGLMREGFGSAAADMPPLATIQQSGVLWGLGTDGTAANQYMPFNTLAFAVTGKMVGGAQAIRQTVSR